MSQETWRTNLIWSMQKYRISGDLENTDNVMNNTFWLGVQPSLTPTVLEFLPRKIESYLGVNF